MASVIELPSCVQEMLNFLYPTMDWERVTFFKGRPFWLRPEFGAITIPNPIGVRGFRVYLGDDVDFCDAEVLSTIVHEGYHVLQFSQQIDGYGLGLLSGGIVSYLACAIKYRYDNHPYELPAYAHEELVRKCLIGKTLPCNCDFDVVRTDIPAMNAFKDCAKDLPVTRAEVPTCTKNVLVWALAILVAAFLAVIAIPVYIWDMFRCRYLRAMERHCLSWGKTTRQKCQQWADQGHNECSNWADEGYVRCDSWADQGYNKCCDWKPCKWFCEAFVWVSKMVCVASVWIVQLVCKAFYWVSNVVCILFTIVTEFVCLTWTTIWQLITLCFFRR